MRSIGYALAAALLLPLATAQAAVPATTSGTAQVPAYITKAMHDPARAGHLKGGVMQNDTLRKMADVLTFTGVKPNDTVLELLPGTGYWTRVFSQIVKPHGHVYTVWSDNTKPDNKNWVNWEKLVKTEHYADVTMLRQYMGKPHAPVPVDIVFTDDNYHDLHDPYWGPQKQALNMTEFNQAVYAALKPGGVFVIVDHIAPAGSGTSDTNTLHRIDPAVVKKEVESVGFVFDGSSDALVNPKDPLTVPVFDKSIRGHTSQFIYRFRKPAK